MKIIDINHLIDGGKAIYDKMTVTQYSIDRSWEHCHNAFLKIKQKYQDPKTQITPDEMDFLCLSLGWYLASWGMLRNSFLNEYSHEIHKNAIQVIYDHRWDSLWDIDYATLTLAQAKDIQTLAKELEDTYISIHQFPQANYQLTDTLKTKILLGTIIKTNKDRLHRALLPYAVGLSVHRKLSGLMGACMVISPATRR